MIEVENLTTKKLYLIIIKVVEIDRDQEFPDKKDYMHNITPEIPSGHTPPPHALHYICILK